MPTAAVRTRTDYACSGSEDEVTKRVSYEGLLPRLARVVEINP